MAPKKSIFRQPGAQHFQLVHRSQRDPLIHDSEASQRVLKAFTPSNQKKGKSRADLEALLPADVLAHDARLNVGEAALYGINYDDTEYDYMQHLRPVGVEEEGVESILIEAPTTIQKSKGKGKGKAKERVIELRDDLPEDVLPSKHEMPRNYEAEEAVPSSISGFQPDMDPHLRQALDALEDDAFVDDSMEEDFFAELIEEGERDEDDNFDYEFHEWGETEGHSRVNAVLTEATKDDESWEVRFAKFKFELKAAPPQSESDDISEDRDTISALPRLAVIGGKRRRKGNSDASGYSMSSSSMYRTETLQTLDERFDRIMEKQYNSEGEDTEDLETPSDVSDEAPELITSREDFEALLSELDNYEILGRKMKPVLEGETGPQKLEMLRRSMGQDERVRMMMDGEDEGPDDNEIFAPFEGEDKKDRWDCETILTTYSNFENHPRIISVRSNRRVPKIRLDPRTGLPSVEEKKPAHSQVAQSNKDEEHEPRLASRETLARPRNESKEEKKARKQAVKAERSARRVEKKGNREQFSSEMKQQAQGMAKANMRTRRL